VLNLVDLIVHHGGTGTVLGAAAAGLPQLILPQGADHFLNADLIAQSGVGRSLLNDAQEDGAIGEAVRAMLNDCPERRRAAELRGEMAAMPGPDEVVTALERLVAGG
jgi:UDP:flavonoid glycosyltransferase YjiC (YdhE family)